MKTLRERGWQTYEPIRISLFFLDKAVYSSSIGIIDLVHELDTWKRRITARSLANLLGAATQQIMNFTVEIEPLKLKQKEHNKMEIGDVEESV